VGSELVVNGGFDTDLSGWQILNADGTHSVTWVGGKARYISDTTSPQLIFRQLDIMKSGNAYRFNTDLDIESGSFKTNSDFTNFSLVDGENSNVVQATGAALGLTRNGPNTTVNIDNVSVKRLIEVAP